MTVQGEIIATCICKMVPTLCCNDFVIGEEPGVSTAALRCYSTSSKEVTRRLRAVTETSDEESCEKPHRGMTCYRITSSLFWLSILRSADKWVVLWRFQRSDAKFCWSIQLHWKCLWSQHIRSPPEIKADGSNKYGNGMRRVSDSVSSFLETFFNFSVSIINREANVVFFGFGTSGSYTDEKLVCKSNKSRVCRTSK